MKLRSILSSFVVAVVTIIFYGCNQKLVVVTTPNSYVEKTYDHVLVLVTAEKHMLDNNEVPLEVMNEIKEGIEDEYKDIKNENSKNSLYIKVVIYDYSGTNFSKNLLSPPTKMTDANAGGLGGTVYYYSNGVLLSEVEIDVDVVREIFIMRFINSTEETEFRNQIIKYTNDNFTLKATK